MRNIFFILTFLIFNIICAVCQKAERFSFIDYDQKLESDLFHQNETLKDSLLAEDYYDKPINTDCFVSGDFLENHLMFCDCVKKDNMVTIVLSSPVVCCFNELTIKIIEDKFTSFSYQSYDISPAHVLFHPKKQKLIIKIINDNFIEGFINFEGRGKYEEVQEELTKEEKSQRFHNKVEGYFKCKFSI